MHVLITVNACWNILNFRKALVKKLISNGHQVSILAPTDETASELESLGCQILPLSMNVKGLNPLHDLRLIWTFKNIFRQHKPDIVLSYTIKNNIFGAIAARECKVPFIPNVTGLGTAFLSGGMLQHIAVQLYRYAFRKTPILFLQNEDDREFLETQKIVTREQSRVLPGSGVDLREFSPAEYKPCHDGPIVFLMIARLLRDKGVQEFVDAAAQVKKCLPTARFQLLGAIASNNRTAINSETVDQWVKSGVIEYLGTTTDVRPHISKCDCVVLPSYREGAPRTLIEGAAMAKPLIATDVPGCRSVVEDGVTGFLCEVRQSESLADACLNFAKLSENERHRMGLEGRMKMEAEYDHLIVIGAYETAIGELTQV
jgi:glycosyltransferase involved in cell wall biosynthesis